MKIIRIFSIILLLFTSLGALIAGYLFIADPSGSKLHITVDWLKHSPFDNFLIPGIVLFIVNGLLNLIAAVFTVFELKNYGKLIIIQGGLLIGWITIQVIMLQKMNFLHYNFLVIGILLLIFGLQLSSNKKI